MSSTIKIPLWQGKAECEGLGKPVWIAANLFIKPLDRHAVKGGKIGIKDDGLTAEADDGVPGFWLASALDRIHETTIPCLLLPIDATAYPLTFMRRTPAGDKPHVGKMPCPPVPTVGIAPKDTWGQRRGTRRTKQSVVTALGNRANQLYFAGRMMELSGKSDIARKYYTRCLETESKERCNYVLASVALRR